MNNELKPKRKKAPRKPIPVNSGMRSCIISLASAWNEQIAQQETIAIQFYNRVLYLLRNNFFYHEHIAGKSVKFDDQTFKFDLKYPSFESVYDQIKGFEQYSMLPSQVAQNIAKLVIDSFKSYKGLILAKKKGTIPIDTKINLPRYKKVKDELLNPFVKAKIITIEMTYDRGNFTKKGRELVLTPMTVDGKKLNSKITFRLPQYLEEVTVNTVTITKNGAGYVAHVTYRKNGFVEIDPQEVDPNQAMTLDLGVNNLATIVNSVTGDATIVDGRYIKSVNQRYNKLTADLRSKMDTAKDQREKDRYFKCIQKVTIKRNRTLRDFMHKVAKRVATDAVNAGVKHVVVGYNQGWKNGVDLGNKTNQKFVSIPYLTLINNLKDKLEQVGIQLTQVEESYTSKVDHLAGEAMCHQESYLGRRKKRGLFQSSTGRLINADVNGAIGILRKCNADSVVTRISNIGRFFRPVRIYPGVAKHCHRA